MKYSGSRRKRSFLSLSTTYFSISTRVTIFPLLFSLSCTKNFKSSFVDLAQISLPFLKLIPDFHREEGEEAFDVKNFKKKVKIKLRRGGGLANHRTGGTSATPSSSSPTICFWEKGELLSLSLT